jgi:predicted SprT family Zn-dependent metalloprotease
MTRVIRKRGAITTNFPRKAEFVTKVRECFALAKRIYPQFTIDPNDIPIVFYKAGNAVGKASHSGKDQVYNIEFNIDAINKEFGDMVDNTIPHEVGHIVDHFINKSFSHGLSWKQISQSLGCDGKRTTNGYQTVNKARKTRTYQYKVGGDTLEISSIRHGKLKRGVTYRYRGIKLTINNWVGSNTY